MLTARKIARFRAQDLRLVSQMLLVIQLLSLGHLLTVAHITCPEHGDIIHVEPSDSRSHAQSGEDETAPITRSVAAAEPMVGAEHDHCLVCAQANRRCLLTGPAQTFAFHLFITRAAHTLPTVPFAPIALILLSPKNSPPSA
jgi:hypothetical protein